MTPVNDHLRHAMVSLKQVQENLPLAGLTDTDAKLLVILQKQVQDIRDTSIVREVLDGSLAKDVAVRYGLKPGHVSQLVRQKVK